jgi:hypothetical protein
MSCDLLPTERPGPHYQGDVMDIINDGWDMMIAHPPCTYLCSAGLNWINRIPGRIEEINAALDFFRLLLSANINKIAIENPVGLISSHIRKPDQYIQPYWFGHSAQKKTCLWLKNLPSLTPTEMVDRGEIYITKSGKSRGGAWTMKLSDKSERWKTRSRTFQGIANAMAEQWS